MDRDTPSPVVNDMTHGLNAMPTSTQDDMSGNPLKEGILADNGWQNRGVRDEAFASVRTAEFDLPGLKAPSMELDSRFPTHKFLVFSDGSVFDRPEPTDHESIARSIGDAESILRNSVQGQLFGTGEARIHANPMGLSAKEIANAASDHYGRPVEVDPNDDGLQKRSPEDRFGLDQYRSDPEQQAVDARGGRPFGYYDNPFVNRGGKVAEYTEIPMETVGIAPPYHKTEDVPVQGLGLHNDVNAALKDIGAYVNGQPMTPEYSDELQKHWSGVGYAQYPHESQWPQNRGQPIMLSHPDPEKLALAKAVVESGSSEPVRRYLMGQQAKHKTTIQIPKGITDNLHATLGNLQAWVENPYENGALRPYYNKYWKAIRPAFTTPGSLRIGVSDPQMAEIINHVAHTDDITPLYEYRGVKKPTSHRIAGPALALAPELLAGGAAAGAEGAGAAGAGALSAGGVGGLMGGAMSAGRAFSGLHGLGMMMGLGGGAGNSSPGYGTTPGGGGAAAGMPIEPGSYYARVASDEDNASPASHDEIPKAEDGDPKQHDDGAQDQWQNDVSVNGGGGTDGLHFQPGSAGLERFMMMLPLVMHYFNSEESGEHDPLLQGLHQSLEQEIPGYLDHGDPHKAQEIIMLLGNGDQANKPQSDDHSDEAATNQSDENDTNSGGKREASVQELYDFLPIVDSTPPGIPGLSAPVRVAHDPYGAPEGIVPGAVTPEEEALQSSSWPEGQVEMCPHCGEHSRMHLGMCPVCGEEVYPHGEGQQMALQHTAGDTQGPQTPEQISAVQRVLIDQGRIDELPLVPTHPLDFADLLAEITGKDNPPDGVGADPNSQPQPAQESAPPGATMPMPGMDANSMQQMMGAVGKYANGTPCPKCGLGPVVDGRCYTCNAHVNGWENAPDTRDTRPMSNEPYQSVGPPGFRAAADSVAKCCPKCDSHTTELLNEDGDSRCHACGNTFKTDGLVQRKLESHVASWDVDEDLLVKEAAGDHHEIADAPAGQEQVSIPVADQVKPEDHRLEQDSGHTWVDSEGNPLKVGQEYEMYTGNFDIPDVVSVDQVKPGSVVITDTGSHGFGHASEVTKEEADVEQYSFVPTTSNGEVQPDGLEENNDDNTAFEGAPEQTDLSRPHSLVSASVNPSLEWLRQDMPQQSPGREWLNDGNLHTAGAKFTPMEQRGFIDESGTARNADKLDLAGTHYIQDADDDQFIFGL